MIAGSVSDTDLVTLRGNTRAEANAQNDRGPVADSVPMDHMLLQLRRSPEREQALEKYLDELQDPKSPNYHRWLTAEQVGEQYGLAQQDLETIASWLKSHGFAVNKIYPNAVVIDFSGTAGQINAAFHTSIHNLQVNGVAHIANMSDPQIPAALAPAIVGVVSMNDFRPHPMSKPRNTAYTFSGCGDLTNVPDCYTVVPADLATIYNLNPAFAAGYTGKGQTIVVIEDSDVYKTSDWNTFRSTLGLKSAYPNGSLAQVHPGNCNDPGVVTGADGEAEIDAEWSSAAAPNAAIEVAACADTSTTFGGFIAMENLLNAAGQPPAIMSISYGQSEAQLGASQNEYIASLYQQAVAEGVSVFVAAGDEGAASSDANDNEATHGIAVSGFASTPYNVAMGGTDFGDSYAGTNSNYWSNTNGGGDESALSYIPEIPWNDSCASGLIASYLGYPATFGSESLCNSDQGLEVTAGSGGPSGCATGNPSQNGIVSGGCQGYQKPDWQRVLGNPNDGVRDLPDLSLFAADGVWNHYYVVCYSNGAGGGTSCSEAPSTWAGFGGTSFSSPIMAAIQALINEKTGARQGNPNPMYYALANAEYGSSGSSSCNSSRGNGVGSDCVFYNVTEGDMDVPCTGTHNCYAPSGKYGVLSASNSEFEPAYGTNSGWNFATGIGTVNAYNLINAFSSSGATPTPTATPTGSTTPSATPTSTSTSSTPTPTQSATPTPTSTPTMVPGLLEIKPLAKNFGTVKPGHFKIATFTLRNLAKSGPPITFGNPLALVTGTSAFQTVTTTCTAQLLPNEKCKLKVEFAPQSAGPSSTSITIFDNAANGNQTIPVEGIGK